MVLPELPFDLENFYKPFIVDLFGLGVLGFESVFMGLKTRVFVKNDFLMIYVAFEELLFSQELISFLNEESQLIFFLV